MTTAKPVQGGKGKARERVLAGENVAAPRDVLLLSKVVLTITRMMREEQIKCVIFELEQQDDSNRSIQNLLECTSWFYANFRLESQIRVSER